MTSRAHVLLTMVGRCETEDTCLFVDDEMILMWDDFETI